MQSTADKPSYPPAGLFTRLVAMFYDSLLLLSALLIATALALLATKGTLHYHNPFFRTYLFLIWFGSLWQALLRFMVAIPSLALGGIGLWWMLIDRDKLALHDRFSESRIVRLPKKQPGQ